MSFSEKRKKPASSEADFLKKEKENDFLTQHEKDMKNNEILKEENSILAEKEAQKEENNGLQFEVVQTNDFDFTCMTFENENDSFTGTILGACEDFEKEHEVLSKFEGFLCKDLKGNHVILPNYVAIQKFLEENYEENKICRITFLKEVDLKGGRTFKKFKFELAK